MQVDKMLEREALDGSDIGARLDDVSPSVSVWKTIGSCGFLVGRRHGAFLSSDIRAAVNGGWDHVRYRTRQFSLIKNLNFTLWLLKTDKISQVKFPSRLPILWPYEKSCLRIVRKPVPLCAEAEILTD